MPANKERPPLTPKEAIAQIGYIRELVDRTRVRVADWYLFFLTWGVLWIFSYTAEAFGRAEFAGLPRLAENHVAVVRLVGFGFVLVVFMRSSNNRPTPERSAGPTLARQLSILNGFIVFACAFLVPLLARRSLSEVDGLIPFAVGVAYVATGIFVGKEMIAIGGWIVVASIASAYVPADGPRQLWLAATTGGGFIATGLVLRRIALKSRPAS